MSARRPLLVGGGGDITRVRSPGIQLVLLPALAVSSFAIQFVSVLSVRQDLTVTCVATRVSEGKQVSEPGSLSAWTL